MTLIVQPILAKEMLNRAMYNSLPDFIRRTFRTIKPGEEYVHNWHIDCIAEYLMACEKRQIKRLIINMPPRTLKSIAVSVAFPAWLMGRDPSTNILCASYAQSLATEHSVNCRMVVESKWFKEAFPEFEMAKDQNEKTAFMSTMMGKRTSTSVGGTATGKGGQFIIVDDPLNPKQAASAVEREKANVWMSATIPPRLNSQLNDVIIVVMQRLHEDDVTGHLIEKGNYELLSLPAKNDRTRVIQINGFKKVFEENELLFEEKFPQEVLNQIELDVGSFEFAGQYLQAPVPRSGGIYKPDWWREWTAKGLPSCEYILQVYDTAFKDGLTNDYSARTTWGIFRDNNDFPNLILLDSMNKRLNLPELKTEVKESYDEFDPDLVLIEDKASGISLIQELKRLNIRLRPLQRGKGDDKVSRAHVASVMLEQGAVWYPSNSPWANEVIRQCASFPNGKYDDLVDTVSDALLFLRRYKGVTVKSDPKDMIATDFKPYYGGHYG